MNLGEQTEGRGRGEVVGVMVACGEQTDEEGEEGKERREKVIEPEGGRGAGAGGAASTSSSFGHGAPGEMKTGSESDSTVCSTERARICRATSICRGTTTRFHACSSYFQSGHSWRLLASLNMAFKKARVVGCAAPRVSKARTEKLMPASWQRVAYFFCFRAMASSMANKPVALSGVRLVLM